MMKQKQILAAVLGLATVAGSVLTVNAQSMTLQQQNTSLQSQQQVTVQQNSLANAPNAVDAGNHVLFRVANPTANQISFSVPELGINQQVPAGEERTFFVDMSRVMDREVAYTIGDGTNQLASGTLINEDYRQVGDTTSIASIINYSTAYNVEPDPEPNYYERPASYRAPAAGNAGSVRGYW